MDDTKVYEVDMPANYPLAACRPTKPEDRLPRDMIRVVPVEGDADVREMTAIIYVAQPDLFWDSVERPDARPSLDIRIDRLAKHFKACLEMEGYHAVKAVHAESGDVMGVAIWHESGKQHSYPTTYPSIPGVEFPDSFVPGCWRSDIAGSLNWHNKPGYSPEEVREMYEHHSDEWKKEFIEFDTGRVNELKDQPHWYLAPLMVKAQYRARGVGTALMMYGIERADKEGLPCVLESMPNSRPVYYHLGFVPTAEHGAHKETQLFRAARMAKS